VFMEGSIHRDVVRGKGGGHISMYVRMDVQEHFC